MMQSLPITVPSPMVTLSHILVLSPMEQFFPMVTKSPTHTLLPSLALNAMRQRPLWRRKVLRRSESYFNKSARAEYAFSTLTIVGVTGFDGTKSLLTRRIEARLL